MKLAFCFLASAIFSSAALLASESASDCGSANEVLMAGLEANPKQGPMLFLDALRTNPGCRRDLLRLAMESSLNDPEQLKKVLFIARQEFPGEQTSFAELALSVVPDQSDLIREAFFSQPEQKEPVAAVARPVPALVEMPPEANDLDDGIREAIARMSAKVEGKLWPEQHVSDEKITYHKPDDVRIPKESRDADESSLENGVPIDTTDERRIAPGEVVINDSWEPNRAIELDESKFSQQGDTRVAREARKKVIAPAGSVGFPMQYPMPKSSIYYIPPAKGDFRSTIDLNDAKRPPLIIRSASSAPTTPE
ncbi:MAG: hypothetical protein P1U68_08470 [Verrucomicrobiales bacterium]|nr:hypothetical protein [Verrucomicrobiales bacterium]